MLIVQPLSKMIPSNPIENARTYTKKHVMVIII